MIEKVIKDIWILLFVFLLVVALTLGAATFSFKLMNESSTLTFCAGGIM